MLLLCHSVVFIGTCLRICVAVVPQCNIYWSLCTNLCCCCATVQYLLGPVRKFVLLLCHSAVFIGTCVQICVAVVPECSIYWSLCTNLYCCCATVLYLLEPVDSTVRCNSSLTFYFAQVDCYERFGKKHFGPVFEGQSVFSEHLTVQRPQSVFSEHLTVQRPQVIITLPAVLYECQIWSFSSAYIQSRAEITCTWAYIKRNGIMMEKCHDLNDFQFSKVKITPTADPSGRAVEVVGLRPFACWDCGFESHR